MAIWESIDDIVTKTNSEADVIDATNGNSDAMRLKLNKFADMTASEVRQWTGLGQTRRRADKEVKSTSSIVDRSDDQGRRL